MIMNPAHLTATELAVWTAAFGTEFVRALNADLATRPTATGRTDPDTSHARWFAEVMAKESMLAFREVERDSRY